MHFAAAALPQSKVKKDFYVYASGAPPATANLFSTTNCTFLFSLLLQPMVFGWILQITPSHT
jgi:hypothetical protein